MTRPVAAQHVVIAHDGPPRGYWRTIVATSDEAKAMQTYKDQVFINPSAGGVRLLKDGIPILHAGALGKPGGEE